MIGEVVDGHEILRSLGTGGMGEVYLARSSTGALRAFKVVRADRVADRQAAGRFRREVLALRRLEHPGIVQIHEAGSLPNGTLYLGMEYVAGPDVQAAVTSEGPFGVADGLQILMQVASALAYAHHQGVVHRDLKPSNVILADGHPAHAKIIDFGLAKIAADEGLTRLTEDQQVLGSPLYWAPEQSSAAQVGPAADVYALGGIAYYVLTGEPLFTPRPAVALVYAHLHQKPDPLANRLPGIELPVGLDELVRACVAKAAADRPSAQQLVAELEEMLAQVVPSAPRVRRPPRLFTSSGTSDMEQAVTNQIRQVLLDLAHVLDKPTDEIDQIQNELSELELELAMLDSQVEAVLDEMPESEQQRDGTAVIVADLQESLANAYRSLLHIVVDERADASDEAQALFSELDALFEQYRSL